MRSPYDAFLQIVDSGSISKACAELNISQPALSKQLRRLEDELKVKLFERSPNGVKLTAYGEALIAPARTMRDAGHSARMTVERLRQSFSGHVAFGVSAPLASNIMPRVALELLTSAPGLEITVVDDRPETLLGMVRRSELEFAICSSYQGFSDEFNIADLFGDISFVMAAARHEIFNSERIDPRQLADYHWVGPITTVENRLAAKFRNLGVSLPRMRVETLSIVQTVLLVELGRFLTFLPTVTVRSQLASRSLIPILPELFSSNFYFKAVSRKGTPLSPGARLILEAFLSVERSL